jgi:hypothetical protein
MRPCRAMFPVRQAAPRRLHDAQSSAVSICCCAGRRPTSSACWLWLPGCCYFQLMAACSQGQDRAAAVAGRHPVGGDPGDGGALRQAGAHAHPQPDERGGAPRSSSPPGATSPPVMILLKRCCAVQSPFCCAMQFRAQVQLRSAVRQLRVPHVETLCLRRASCRSPA